MLDQTPGESCADPGDAHRLADQGGICAEVNHAISNP